MRRISSLPALGAAVIIIGALSGAVAPAAVACPPGCIAAENAKQGTPPSIWDISGAGSPALQGFATDISVNVGSTIGFKVDSTAGSYRIDLYRMGWYGGDGARLIATIADPAVRAQPQCATDDDTGLVDCSNWETSAWWTVPAGAVSGVYFAHLVGATAESHIVFVVRDDASRSDVLFQTSDTTWQAYNQYGGRSLYTGGPGSGPSRAYNVSYNRPITTRGTSSEDWVFNSEYPMIRWLERNGYDVNYTTGVDSDRRGALIRDHRVFLSVGHDEYWSGPQRANVEAARSAGVSLAFFSGNEVFWKTRWEDGYRTLVSYKETHDSAKIDPTGVWTGSWRDPRPFNPEGGRPENALTGTLFMVNSGDAALEVPPDDGLLRLWRTSAVAAQAAAGQTARLTPSTVGYEWDEDVDNGARPAGLVDLSSTTVANAEVLQDYGHTYGPGSATHHLTLYRATNGAGPDALVFGAGTVQWSWGLDSSHDRGAEPPDASMQQATVNLMADIGVQPGTLQAGLSSASASTDTVAPSAFVTTPASGEIEAAGGEPIRLSGTASDAGGGRVGAVEVSVDGGASWHPAVGRESWSYTWTPSASGRLTVRVRAADDSGNLGPPPVAAPGGAGRRGRRRGEQRWIAQSYGRAGHAPQHSSLAQRHRRPPGCVPAQRRTLPGHAATGAPGQARGVADARGGRREEQDVQAQAQPSGAPGARAPPLAARPSHGRLAQRRGRPRGDTTHDPPAGAAPALREETEMLRSSTRAAIRNAVVAFALILAAGAWAGASAARAQSDPGQGPGGPILVVVDPGDPFGRYYAEILRAEGLNEFAVADVSTVTPASLAGADAVMLAKAPLSPSQVAMFTNYVGAGGNLIAMRPDKQLAPLLGLADTGATLANGYMRIDTGGPPGAGVTGATMQYHDIADRYALAGATTVATLYADAGTATASPAVTLRDVGANGGQVASFSYDLARSVVETRQGDPARAGQELDGLAPIRSDDLFFPNWLDFNKVAIPQADEQQRLLANLITDMTLDRKPLPRFWYLPRGEKAAVVMSGDDHANGGTSGQFDRFMADSPPGCSVADWQCVRATSYVYTGTPLTDAQAAAYQAAGFEIALHYRVSGPADCNDFGSATIGADLGAQLDAFAVRWPSLAAPVTNRTHCIVFSDWSSEPRAERAHGIRLDANYYYWPGTWVGDRPGLFTGSGFPMRFAADDGALIDVYQLATQITDESDMNIPAHIRALIDGALGTDGYYGVFTANMHTDVPTHPGADAIVAEAQRRGVPVVSAAQMLTWLDGRNDSSFGGLSFAAGQLRFHLNAAPGSRGLQAMIPTVSSGGALQGLSRDGRAVPVDQRTVKGISYVLFDAAPGDYVASYPAVATGAGATAGSVLKRRPKVRVKLLSKRVSKRGTIAFRVTCPAAGIRCRVGILLKRGRATAARKTVTVRGNTSVKVTLRLTKATRRRLARARRLTLKGRITASYGDGSRSTETLRVTVRRR